ncbi:MAG: hypothetical protein Q8908_13690, partial [Bacteroidota bacterium]|nr:hypothetical protein [Bacteroidota bacterium]
FERGIKIPVADSSSQHQATGFFGDTMPMTDIQTLVEPENNPDVVDLRQSKQYVAAQIKSDSLNIVTLLRKDEAKENGEPIIQKPDCIKLKGLLNAYTRQRSEFQKTILLSNSQLDIWEAQNRNALVNAAKDGIDYFIGAILDALKNRGEIADKYQMVLDNNVNQMMGEGIDVTKIQNEIAQLRKISARGQTADFLSNLKDWNTFMKDGLSSLIGELSESNKDVSGILEDPMMKKYFEPESSKLNTLLDISKIVASNGIWGKWVEKRMPLVAGIEFAIKETYNATDWILSYKRMAEAQKINGGVMDTAKYIQQNIDNTYSALKDCP